MLLPLRQLAPKVHRRLLRYTWRLRCAFSPNQMFSFKLPDGSRFDYPINSALGGELFLHRFEPAEITFMRKSLKSGDVVFDIGANGGLFTVIAAKQIGLRGHVFAFEPGERELQLLRHNIAINHISNVTVVPCAVSNVSGTARFAISHDGAMNSLGQTNHPEQHIEKWETVETICLNDFIEQQGIASISFIKVDVEGAERQVILGGNRLLARDSQTKIMFESYTLNTTGFDYTPEQFLSELAGQGLFLYAVNQDGDLTLLDSGFDNPDFGHRIYSFVVSASSIQTVYSNY